MKKEFWDDEPTLPNVTAPRRAPVQIVLSETIGGSMLTPYPSDMVAANAYEWLRDKCRGYR